MIPLLQLLLLSAAIRSSARSQQAYCSQESGHVSAQSPAVAGHCHGDPVPGGAWPIHLCSPTCPVTQVASFLRACGCLRAFPLLPPPEEALPAWCGLTWPLSLQHAGQRGNHDSIHWGVQSPAPCLVPSRCAVCSLAQPMTMKPKCEVLHLLKTQNPFRSEWGPSCGFTHFLSCRALQLLSLPR